MPDGQPETCTFLCNFFFGDFQLKVYFMPILISFDDNLITKCKPLQQVALLPVFPGNLLPFFRL